MSIRYRDVVSFTNEHLTLLGRYDSMPTFDHGPVTAPRLKLSPSRLVFLSVGNGSGLTTEELFDQTFIVVRAIGEQNDYDDAEQLAQDIDRIFLNIGSNATIGEASALYITRTGGPPTLVQIDDADRYHFQCSYITEVIR